MDVDLVYGFLGAGKTTFITRILNDWRTTEKIVVLVNEFGDVGVDGELLAGHGGQVVEMPSGCICCTLLNDFRTQIADIRDTHHPDRIIIEPSGVATISQLRRALDFHLRDGNIESLRKILVVDAVGFIGLYKSSRLFVESQIRCADVALLNKCDRVAKSKALLVRSSLSAINPELTVFQTRFGEVDWREYHHALSAVSEGGSDGGVDIDHIADIRHISDYDAGAHSIDSSADAHHEQSVDLPDPGENIARARGYESFGVVWRRSSFDRSKLTSFFQELPKPDSTFGDVVRAKGLFRTGEGWLVLELASGDVAFQPIRPRPRSKVSIIGADLNRERLREALAECKAP